jgi:hypothetical protein
MSKKEAYTKVKMPAGENLTQMHIFKLTNAWGKGLNYQITSGTKIL